MKIILLIIFLIILMAGSMYVAHEIWVSISDVEISLHGKIAMAFVSGLASRASLAVIVRGTESSMPIGPNTQPQKTSDKKTTSGESPNPFPRYLGSINEPMKILMIINPMMAKLAVTLPSWT